MIKTEDLKLGACFIETGGWNDAILQIYGAENGIFSLRGFTTEGHYTRRGFALTDVSYREIYQKTLTPIDSKAFDKLKKLNDVYRNSVSLIFKEYGTGKDE